MPLEPCLSHPSPTPILSLATPAQRAGASGISEKAIWVAREPASKKAGGETVGTLLPPALGQCEHAHPVPSRFRTRGPGRSPTSLALSRYPARHPFQGCMASFKLCYYGDGRAVTVPLAWIIKSEREAEGSRAQWRRLLCSLRLEEEPRGRNTIFCNWFLSERGPCLQVPSQRLEKRELEKVLKW